MPTRAYARSLGGFTLVELMVVLVIVAMLASLTLAGLSGVRERAKADKTRSTIRKINAVIQPMYESYATRRVPATGSSPRTRAENRLRNIRVVMTVEMPDLWDDVGFAFPASFNWAQNAVHRRYTAYKTAVNAVTAASDPRFTRYESAETLMMIMSRSGFEPDCMAAFRADEIGDIDRDGAAEFWDGWGRPIAFRRWPASFASPLLSTSTPDPLDTMRLTADWAMFPLIFSAGADEANNDPLSGASGYAFRHRTAPSWLQSLTGAIPPVPSTCVGNDNGGINAADPDQVRAASDNITNYDLLKK
jgi:prepilin-type N-terminal cleavage/methylation domain-containing protein